MTRDTELEHLLDRWLADGPTEVSDRALDDAVHRLRRTEQRPAWRLIVRDLAMTTPIRLTAAAAAVAILVIGGVGLFGGLADLGIGGPPPTPVVTGSPTPRPSLCPTTEPSCIGQLEPGRHTTSQLITPFSFVVPDGWQKPLDVPGSVNLKSLAEPSGNVIAIPDWVIVTQSACTRDPEPGVGRTVDDLVAFLTEHPGLITSTPAPVRIGGLEGITVDVETDPAWEGPCLGRVNLFTHRGTLNDPGWWDIADSTRMRLSILDAGDGHVVTIHIEAGDINFDRFAQEATPVVESFDFSP